MEELCRLEVIDLHKFFGQWFRGEVENTEKAFSRLEISLGSTFVLISPQGKERERSQLIDSLREAYGSREEGFSIAIKNYHFRFQKGDLALVTYEEWQREKGSESGRISTALFCRNGGEGPHHVKWLHLQETALAKEGRENG